MNDTLEQFRQAIAATGLQAPDVIHDDGAIHRFSSSGRASDKAAWYVLHVEGIPAGAFGDWRSGLQSTWCAKSDNAMTPAEREANRQRVMAMQVQRDADKLQTQQQASETALQRFNEAKSCTQHAYTDRKGVQCHGVRIDAAGALLIPMRDIDGKLHSLQSIMSDGEKRFHPGGRIKGCYHSIGGKPAGYLVIAEGYATAATVGMATNWPAAASFTANNLLLVATALHKAYPALTLLIAADDDWRTDGNPGMTAAKQAALAVGGFVVVPQFPAGRPDKATDFNDLAALAGLSAVWACFSEIEVLSC